jgi:lipoprotein NlpD
LTGNKNQSNINNTQQNVENVHQVTVSRSWKWPTKGRVVRRFDTHDPTRNGIDIAGVEGQPVYVADAGRVVYSGNGLASYGNLIIVRHDDRYLTAYGYNAEVLIKEGDELKAGTMIARMGKGPDNTPKLHFQVRVDGKPVNPLNYLPK